MTKFDLIISAVLYRISIQTDVMHGSFLLMEFVLQSMTQRKQNIIHLLEEIVFHTLWIMSEFIQRGHYDPSEGDGSYRPETVVKLVVGWMMTPNVVGFEFFGGRALSCVQTELKVNRETLSSRASRTNSVQFEIGFI